jgi:hypothetical protein
MNGYNPKPTFKNYVESIGLYMAERKGFEPSRQLPAYTLSKRAPSTTRPPLRNLIFLNG